MPRVIEDGRLLMGEVFLYMAAVLVLNESSL